MVLCLGWLPWLGACTSAGVAQDWRPGDMLQLHFRAGDQLLLKKTERVYGLDGSGRLTADPLAQNLVSGIQVFVTQAVLAGDGIEMPAPVGHAPLQDFLDAIWREVGFRYGHSDPRQTWAWFEERAPSLEMLRADFLQSGLSPDEYVDFHVALDEYRIACGSMQWWLHRLLARAAVTHVQLIEELERHHLTWRQFLAIMAARGDDMQALVAQWQDAGADQGLGAFLGAYLQWPPKHSMRPEPYEAQAQQRLAWFARQLLRNAQPTAAAQSWQILLPKAPGEALPAPAPALSLMRIEFEYVQCTKELGASDCLYIRGRKPEAERKQDAAIKAQHLEVVQCMRIPWTRHCLYDTYNARMHLKDEAHAGHGPGMFDYLAAWTIWHAYARAGQAQRTAQATTMQMPAAGEIVVDLAGENRWLRQMRIIRFTREAGAWTPLG